jgi:sorting nexin-25
VARSKQWVREALLLRYPLLCSPFEESIGGQRASSVDARTPKNELLFLAQRAKSHDMATLSTKAALYAVAVAFGAAILFQRVALVKAFALALSLITAGLLLPLCLAFYVKQPPRAHQYRRLAFTTPAGWASAETTYEWEHRQSFVSKRLHPSIPPKLNGSIDGLLDLIIQEFVHKWFQALTSPVVSNTFPQAVETIIRHCFSQVIDRALEVDWPTLLVSKLLPILTSHVQNYKTAGGFNSEDELDLILATKYAALTTAGKLHPAIDVASLNSKPSEEKWLRAKFDSILDLILPAHEKASKAVSVMAREIVANAVVLNVIDMLSDPDFLNSNIDTGLARLLREQDQVKQLRVALDNTSAVSMKRAQARAISATTTDKEFESFLRSIKHLGSLADARRLRNDIDLSLGRTRLSSPEGKLQVYIDRLSVARAKVDKRIKELGGDHAMVSAKLFNVTAHSLDAESICRTRSRATYFCQSDPFSACCFKLLDGIHGAKAPLSPARVLAPCTKLGRSIATVGSLGK